MQKLKDKLLKVGVIFSDTFEKGASFLLEDGTFLNIWNQNIEDLTSNSPHVVLDRFIRNKKLIDDEDANCIYQENKKIKRQILQERILRYTDNACTLQDGTKWLWEEKYIDLPEIQPKGKQLEQLTLYIDYLHYYLTNKKRIHIYLGLKVKTFNIDDDTTDEIIKEMKKMYVERDRES